MLRTITPVDPADVRFSVGADSCEDRARPTSPVLVLAVSALALLTACTPIPWQARVPMTLDRCVSSGGYRVEVTPHGTSTEVVVYDEPGADWEDLWPSWWWLLPSPPTVIQWPHTKAALVSYVGEFLSGRPVVGVDHDFEAVRVHVSCQGERP